MSELDLEMVGFFLEEVDELLSKWEAICLRLEMEVTSEEINSLSRIAHNIKGSSASVGLMKLSEFVHRVEDVIVEQKKADSDLSNQTLKMFFAAQSQMVTWVEVLKNEPNSDFYPQAFMDEYFSSTKEKHENLTTGAESVHEENAVDNVAHSEKVDNNSPADTDRKQSTEVEVKKNKDEILRISTKKIDALISLIGELSIQQSILQNALENCGTKLQGQLIYSSLNLSHKITKEIYDTAFEFRMTPVGGIFQRLERAIKDLARSLGKEIDVEVTGHEIEIEKTILDKMLDPLTHIVRNSVDHGIEPRDKRIACGKPVRGTVRINVSKVEEGIEINVSDDGKGLSEKKILEKAIEKKLVAASASMPREEVFALIFIPGFSTAEAVTNVSGRGVGMDVVMRTIEEVNGKISIGSEEGKGTKFRITIPTSLSIVDSLVVAVNETQYVLPLSFLEEVISLGPDFTPKENKFLMKGKVIPYIHLGEVFNLDLAGPGRDYPVLVTKVNGRRLAIGVESILGRHQSVVRDLNRCFDKSFAVSGGTILPNGEPGLILDISAIIQRFFQYQKTSGEAA